VKRVFDLLTAGLGLLLLAPLGLLLALAVWAGSGFPIFFRHQRVGRLGCDFRLLKFRTMSVAPCKEQSAKGKGQGERGEAHGAKRKGQNARGNAQDAGTFHAGATSRVTPIGRFLRKSKLDELPQLWNVFRGDMSLVGPRPEVRKWVKAYPERWAFVHTVRPGVTDPASIRFRNEEEILAAAADPEATYREVILPQKLALYEEYVRHRSFWGDIVIICRTIAVVVWGEAQSAKGKAQRARSNTK
jgi:lipopolysaccharide/colanic/teichoic acid biosynthesis glycosyltransferase